ncbi:MAG: DUF2809 domain-containing protein [Ardenticatenaceae bacterium]
MNSTGFTHGRDRLFYALMMLLVIGLGLASRSFPAMLPDFIATYAGDTLWALLAFLLIGFLLPSQSTARVGIMALLFASFIEVSQLYQAPWINTIRQTRLGGLVLGYGFLWSDLLCYAVGIAIGALIEHVAFASNSQIDTKGV